MSLTAGIDLGSTYTKAIVAAENGEIVARAARPTGYNFPKAAQQAFDECLAAGGLAQSDISYVASTGFGRYAAPMRDLAITELTCHAYAVHHLVPEARTVLDAGGQTVKALRLDATGRVKGFRLNDKCAAGAGAFLEKTVKYLGYGVEEIAGLADAGTDPVTVSSVCTVFAESEIINHLAAGREPEDVCAGAVIALTGRAAQLVKRVKPEPSFALTGGLTQIALVTRALEEKLGQPFLIPEDDMGRFAGAYGAVLLAHQRLRKVTRETVSA